ncbi:hypothetical protein H8959_007299 [Pygathrix nigripes]
MHQTTDSYFRYAEMPMKWKCPWRMGSQWALAERKVDLMKLSLGPKMLKGFQPNTNTFLNKNQNTSGPRCPQARLGVQAGASSVRPTPSHKRVFCDGGFFRSVELQARDSSVHHRPHGLWSVPESTVNYGLASVACVQAAAGRGFTQWELTWGIHLSARVPRSP